MGHLRGARDRKPEIQNPKLEGNPKPEARKGDIAFDDFQSGNDASHSDLGFGISFELRVSDFGLVYLPASSGVTSNK
jgi:hypothetical protein